MPPTGNPGVPKKARKRFDLSKYMEVVGPVDADTIVDPTAGLSNDFINRMTNLLESSPKVPPPVTAASIPLAMIPEPQVIPVANVGRELAPVEKAAAQVLRVSMMKRPELQPINEPDIPFYAIGAVVRYIREHVGWDVPKMSAFLRVTPAAVYRVENALPDMREFTAPAFQIPVMLELEKLARRHGLMKTALLLDSMTQAVIRRKQKGRG